MSGFKREDCINAVLKSPQAVAANDQQAWVKIFAQYSLVEDPVGSPPHVSGVFDRLAGYRGRGPLERFHSTFITPYEILFHVDRDVVVGCRVVRDLTIEIRMSAKVVVHVPMHLVYELIEEEGELKIFRLAAHWEMMPSIKQQISFGRDSVIVGMLAGLRMCRYLGLGGTVGFMRAIRSVGDQGKQRADTFVHLLNGGNAEGLAGLMDGDSGALLYAGEPISVDNLAGAMLSISTGKMLAAGNFISASCRISCAQGELHGVMFFQFNMKNNKLVEVRFDIEPAS